MENCYSVWILIAILVVVMVMVQMRSENMESSCKQKPLHIAMVNQLPASAKRCSLCNHCRCNIRPVDMPRNPVLYYGGNGKYLAKRLNPYKTPNTFHMCAPSSFGGLEPDVPTEQRQCWIGEELEQGPPPQVPDITCNTYNKNEDSQQMIDQSQIEVPVGEPQPVPEVMNHGEDLHQNY